ncbi:MAG: NADH-quinone oxidoreductase subunit NuoE [Kiritimatiellae bacterium]|nr:NADH-quinone oxidoreductase subunit NuoE [Kiritimatiellia bacterium]
MQATEENELQNRVNQVLARYHGERSELIPILQAVQEAVGYIPQAAMQATARFLRVPESTVYGVVTFYAQFYLTRQGKHKIRVCRGTACHVRGSRRILQALERKLAIKPGQTTPDYTFTLETVACFGSCALAPVVVVDGRVYGKMTPQQAVKIVESLA